MSRSVYIGGIAVAFEVEDTCSASVLSHTPEIKHAFVDFVERVAEATGFPMTVMPEGLVERNVQGVRFYLFAKQEVAEC